MNNWNGLLSLFIACIEFILIINLLVFAEKNKINLLIIILVALLMGYQILEFLMCTLNLNYSYMVYFSIVIISFLPPLNFYFIFKYFGIDKSYLKLIFFPSIALAIYYYFVINKFAVTACSVLYASYNYPLGWLYAIFYYLPILVVIIFLLIIKDKQKNDQEKKKANTLLGGLIFISLPVIAAFVLSIFHKYQLLEVIESVMCKFAFVYAICLSYFALMNKRILNE